MNKKKILLLIAVSIKLILPLHIYAQPLAIKLCAEPFWHPDSTWVMAFPGNSCNCSTSIGLNEVTRLSNISGNIINIDSGFSGRIYFFVQQGDSMAILKDTVGIPSDTSFAIRYDFMEITYNRQSTDCANLSSVDQFGLTLSMAAFDSNNNITGSRGYNINAQTLIQQMDSISKDSSSSVFYKNGTFIRVMSPLHAPEAYFNMANYVNLVETDSTIIKLFAMYDGSTAVYDTGTGTATGTVKIMYDAKPFYYNAQLSTHGDSVLLQPDPSVLGIEGFLQGTIRVALTSLNTMVYACDGPFYVSVDSGQAPATSPDRIGYNDPWSTVMRNFLVGYNLGYYNNLLGNENGNNSWNWNPKYAFQPIKKGEDYSNQYANIIQRSSNSYGFPFTDFILAPLLPLAGCDTLRLSIWSDTTTNFMDYTNIAIDTNGAVVQTDSLVINNYGQNIVFNFTSNNKLCPQYWGTLDFLDSSYSNGSSYTSLAKAPTSRIGCGKITFTGFPILNNSLNQYAFKLDKNTYNLYIQTDSNGNFVKTYTDHPAIITSISVDSQGVTLSNLVYLINPAHLQLSHCDAASSFTNSIAGSKGKNKLKGKKRKLEKK